MATDRTATERLASTYKYDASSLRHAAATALDADGRELFLEAARLVEIGEITQSSDDDLEARRVTPQAELGDYDGYVLELRRCVCGEPFETREVGVGANADLAAHMPCCGALLICKAELTLLELVEPGAPITQPPDDHPIWQTPVAEAGPIAVTLRHMRDSMIEAGGTFKIHGYSADGNPLVDAAGPGDDTLEEIVGQEQQESDA